MSLALSISFLITLSLIPTTFAQAWTPMVIKNITVLGPQLTPDASNVSRDGGYSTLINGKIVWLYDDTECFDHDGNQLSFVSNTAAYSSDPNNNILTLKDFGVINLGTDSDGSPKTAILAGTTMGAGGWIPFQPDEIDYNKQMNGKERVAIWPGTSPTSISTTEAFLFAPLVYVDSKPQDPSKEYQPRGMTLITITAPESGPVATRQGDLIIPGTEVAFGGFSTLVGYRSTDTTTDKDGSDRDVYLLGMTNFGLQLARVGLDDISDYAKYSFWNPEGRNFSSNPPQPSLSENSQIYLPGSFSSGSIFYSVYFQTFIVAYFNKMVDSTFYVRYLQLDDPLGKDPTWISGGKNGRGVEAEDAEALVKYTWSAEQLLYASPPSQGGFNYAGMAHPEYFNTQYYPQSLYFEGTKVQKKQQNLWYGSEVVAESENGALDGKYLLLSWTAQIQKSGGLDNGIYQVQLAVIEFDTVPQNPKNRPSSTATTEQSPGLSSATSTSSTKPHVTMSSIWNAVEKGAAPHVSKRGSMIGYVQFVLAAVFGWLVV